MAITDPLVLPPDVILVPVADLPADLRGRLGCEAGDWAITHPRARTPSRIVDARAGELLAEFKEPRTIVDAVIRYSRSREADPEATLDEAYPFLERLLAAGFLVEEGADAAAGIRPSLAPGDEVAGFEVLDCVQALEDTEVYQVRRAGERAALKIERPAVAGREADAFDREAAILAHLGNTECAGLPGPRPGSAVAPRLLGSGRHEERSYLALEWFSGVDAAQAANELRWRRPDLLRLCAAIASAYAALHERGVVHGDVHPRNVLVSGRGEVRLVDFGAARWDGAPRRLARPGRAGIGFFYEPEYARAVRAGRRAPAVTAAGEQYAVAALLYLLLTGGHYRDFALGRDEMLRQIAQEPPLPFSARDAEPWPEVEAALAKALCKTPGRRHRSMADLVRTLENAQLPAPPVPSRQAGPSPAERLLADWLERVGLAGPLWAGGLARPPRASINFGAAGIAAALYRIALAREDAGLLSMADLWASRAVQEKGEEAFYNAQMEITPERVGRVSPFHTATGPPCVQALVAHAAGREAAQQRAVAAFLAAAGEPCENPDLTLGRSGLLLAAALLLDTVRSAGLDEAPVRAFGDDLLAGLWREIDELPPIPQCGERRNLGMAHGWAGYLYATLRWCRAAGAARPGGLEERLAELAECALRQGRGLRWRWHGAGDGEREVVSMPGWCNGSAGFVHLWTLAHRVLGDSGYAAFAEGAAWNAWEAADGSSSLCCGSAGRAYALLNLYRHGGGREWLDHARALADRAARGIDRTTDAPDSLYRGRPGIAALAADLARPEAAVMPFFEEEGWAL